MISADCRLTIPVFKRCKVHKFNDNAGCQACFSISQEAFKVYVESADGSSGFVLCHKLTDNAAPEP